MTVADSTSGLYNRNAAQRELDGTCNLSSGAGSVAETETDNAVFAHPKRRSNRGVPMSQDIHQIQQLVAEASGLTVLDLCSARRDRRLARTRQLAMWLCRRLTPHSLPAIGREFGDRDHTTVMHGLAVIDRLMAADQAFALDVLWFAQLVDYEQHNGRVAA